MATKKTASKAKSAPKKAAAKPAKKAAAKPAKKAAAKPAAKKAAAKPAKKAARKPNAAFMAKLTPSAELAAVVGSGALSRPDVVSKVWDYIKKNKLQNPANKREILADDKLGKVFGKKKVTMFEMNKHLSNHLK